MMPISECWGNGSCEAIGVVAVVKTLEVKGRNEDMELAIQAGRKANPGEGNRGLQWQNGRSNEEVR